MSPFHFLQYIFIGICLFTSKESCITKSTCASKESPAKKKNGPVQFLTSTYGHGSWIPVDRELERIWIQLLWIKWKAKDFQMWLKCFGNKTNGSPCLDSGPSCEPYISMAGPGWMSFRFSRPDLDPRSTNSASPDWVYSFHAGRDIRAQAWAHVAREPYQDHVRCHVLHQPYILVLFYLLS